MKGQIRLRGINGETNGMSWEGEALLRVGRFASVEVFLDDNSVSRRHAEMKFTPQGWRIRDLGSTNGTFLNGNRLNNAEQPFKAHDVIRCGNITLVVEALRDAKGEELLAPPENMTMETYASGSFEDAIKGLVFDDASMRMTLRLRTVFRL